MGILKSQLLYIRLGIKTMYIEPASPGDNDNIKSFNGKLRDELLDRKVFTALEAGILIKRLRKEYNQARPKCQELSSTRT